MTAGEVNEEMRRALTMSHAVEQPSKRLKMYEQM